MDAVFETDYTMPKLLGLKSVLSHVIISHLGDYGVWQMQFLLRTQVRYGGERAQQPQTGLVWGFHGERSHGDIAIWRR